MISPLQLNVDSVFPSATLQSGVNLTNSFSQLRDRFELGDEFIQDLQTAFNPNQSLANRSESQSFMDVDSMFDDFVGFATGQPHLGHSSPAVAGGTVTLQSPSGTESLTIKPHHRTDIIKIKNESLVIFNRTTNEAIRLKPGEKVTVSGKGELSIPASDSDTLRLSGGETAIIARGNDHLRLKESNLDRTLSIPESGRTFGVGDDGEALTLFTGPNKSVTIQPGDRGRISRSRDGRIQITNRDTGNSMIVEPGRTISTAGADSVDVSGTTFDFSGSDELKVTATEDDSLKITNKSVTGSTTFEDSSQSTKEQLSSRLNTMVNPIAAQTRILGSLLPVSRGDQSDTDGQLSVQLDRVVEPFSDRSLDELPRATNPATIGPFKGRDQTDNNPFRADRGISEIFERTESFVDAGINFQAEPLDQQSKLAFEINENGDETLFSIRQKRTSDSFVTDESTETSRETSVEMVDTGQ